MLALLAAVSTVPAASAATSRPVLSTPVPATATATTTGTPYTKPAAAGLATAGRLYGVLIANPLYQSSDYQAGVRLAMVNLNWSLWEPSTGTFSASYRAQELSILNGYRQAGFTVGVNLGMNYQPNWVLATTNGQLVDQFGAASGSANFEFSHTIRALANSYINDVVASLGAVSYFAIGLSPTSEAVYPTTRTNQWWAFDQQAQGTASGLPVGVSPSPMPGWIPGSSTWRGNAVTVAQAQAWYDWYLNASVNALTWEMTTLQSAGFTGQFQLQWPGNGANPWVYPNRIAALLAPQSYDSFDTLNAGAVYQVVLDRLKLTNVVMDVTSVGDGSGSPRDNACQAGDALVDYTTNSTVNSWSSTRWLSYLAGRHGLPVMGESTGENSASQMANDFTLARACQFVAFQWAFDHELFGGGYATIADYSTQIGNATTATIAIAPTQHTFSTRAVNTTSSAASYQATNTGTAPLTITAVAVSGAAFAVAVNTCGGQTLSPSRSCTIGVTFTPPTAGTFSGSVQLTDNATNATPLITFTGTGVIG